MSASSTEKSKPAATPATAKRRNDGAIYVAYDPEKTNLSIDSSEIKVMRKAVKSGRRVARWGFDQSLDEAIAAAEAAEGDA